MAMNEQRAGPDAARILDSEVDEAVGRDVPEQVSRAAIERRHPLAPLAENKMLAVFTFATAIVVGAVVSLAVGSWWVLAAAVLVHWVGTFLVLALVFALTSERDKPDPVTAARLDDLGVPDSEQRMNDAVERSAARGG